MDFGFIKKVFEEAFKNWPMWLFDESFNGFLDS